jgi:xanthine dehydrogenase accessory factor
MHWYLQLQALAAETPTVMLTVIAVRGSAPRDVGTQMFVTADSQIGTIGGGVLEYQEVAHARALLTGSALAPWTRQMRAITLGADAGQCCGGVVEILHEVFTAPEARAVAAGHRWFERPIASGVPPSSRGVGEREAVDCNIIGSESDRVVETALIPKAAPLTIYGAGHVGRAVVRLLADLPFAVTWIDISRERFADVVAHCNIAPLVLTAPEAWARDCAPGCLHLVVTHSHDLDYAICSGLLRRDDFAFLGLIGSLTKRARFVQRFRRDGIAESAIARLVCPIGDPRVVGKDPAVIAIAVAAQLLQVGSS